MDKFYVRYIAPGAVAHERGECCWSSSGGKRAFDFVAALIGLLLSSFLMILAAVAVRLSSRGPVLFRQTRMGRGGRPFTIYKFRTMRSQEASAGPRVTRVGDSRLTALGHVMRRVKIDELPQLFNVLKGDMSLVGTRPKVPQHQTYELLYRPGITGAATLAFRNEERILHKVAEKALDEYQIHVLMPLKRHIDQNYMTHATFLSDLKVLFATVFGMGDRMDHEHLTRFQDSLLSLDVALRLKFAHAAPVQACEMNISSAAAIQ